MAGGDPCPRAANQANPPAPAATSTDAAISWDGYISGSVTDSATSSPLAGVEVDIHNCVGSYVTYAYTDASGVYTTSGLQPGTYYARTWNSEGYFDELYNNIPCPGYRTENSGTPITVTAGATTAGVNFALARGGRISGTVTDAGTSLPLTSAYVDIYNAAGSWITYAYTDGSGVYTSHGGLSSGTHYALAQSWSGHLPFATGRQESLHVVSGCARGTPWPPRWSKRRMT